MMNQNPDSTNKDTVLFSTIIEALDELMQGRCIIVMDDEDRENEGDLIMAAQFATPKLVSFFVRHTTGILCAPLTLRRAQDLRLSTMVPNGNDPNNTAFTISTDSIDCSTGVSARDRSTTLKQLADADHFGSIHFRRPGHIFPLIARAGGVLERRGHTEASIDLCRLANLKLAGVIGELVNDEDGSMKRLGDCWKFAKKHGLKIITIEQLVAYRRRYEEPILFDETTVSSVELYSECKIPISWMEYDLGVWTLKCFYSHHDGRYHVCLEKGSVQLEPNVPVLTRIHSECFTGDVLGSQRCDCRDQLFQALKCINERRRGLLIYHFGHEGRGIGLPDKILAYHLQQTKDLDTYMANRALGFADDTRNYSTARSIISALNIQSIELLTCNCDKIEALQDITTSVIRFSGTRNKHNAQYLDTKSKRLDSSLTKDEYQNLIQDHQEESIVKVVDDINSMKSIQKIHPPTKSTPNDIPIPPNVGKIRVGIVRTMWNHGLVEPFTHQIHHHLLCKKINPLNITQVVVPGSFELPFAAKQLSQCCDVVICIGVVIKGETLHFEIISHSVSQALMQLQIGAGIPVINSVFNCLTLKQAEARCGPTSQLSESLASTAIYMAGMKQKNDPLTLIQSNC